MDLTNDSIFNRIWRKASHYGLSFISSNGGTGKTVFFKFLFLRHAIENNIPFHIFCRFGNAREQGAASFLAPKPTYSKRKMRLLDKCKIVKVGDKFVYIVEKDTGRKLAQIIDIYGQAFYKPFGNMIGAKRALFDEVLAEDGVYCPDEMNKFNRLLSTLARSDPEYTCVCLYNNTTPNFPYFGYYGGKSYSTHVSKSGALFVYFTAKQYRTANQEQKENSIQSIIENTEYKSVYNNNTFAHYPVFFDNADLKGKMCVGKVEISNRIFKLRYLDNVIFLDDRNARKKSKHLIFTVNRRDESTLPFVPDTLRTVLLTYKDLGRIKTNDINNSIFVKIFCQNL